MRQQGRIAEWNDDRGFGFITPLNADGRIFVHVSEFPRDMRRPLALDLVTYELGQDERGRQRAFHVQFLAPTSRWISLDTVGSATIRVPAKEIIVCLTIIVLTSALVIGEASLLLFLGYVVLSAATYVAYGMDKSAAQRGAFRTEESALHLLALAGGWPGALIAQQHFRHKTRKQPFQAVFWATVVLNALALVAVIALVASS